MLPNVVVVVTCVAASHCLQLPFRYADQHPILYQHSPLPAHATHHRPRRTSWESDHQPEVDVEETTNKTNVESMSVSWQHDNNVALDRTDASMETGQPDPGVETRHPNDLRLDVKQPDLNLATALLRDIRDALHSQHDTNMGQRLAAVTRQVRAVGGEVTRLGESVEQRVALVRDSLATLRLVMTGQAQQLSTLSHTMHHSQDTLILPHLLNHSSQPVTKPTQIHLPSTDNIDALPNLSDNIHTQPDLTDTTTQTLPDLTDTAPTVPDFTYSTPTLPNLTDNTHATVNLHGNTLHNTNQGGSSLSPGEPAEDTTPMAAINALTQQLQELRAQLSDVQKNVAQLMEASERRKLDVVQDTKDILNIPQTVEDNIYISDSQDSKESKDIPSSISSAEILQTDKPLGFIEILKMSHVESRNAQIPESQIGQNKWQTDRAKGPEVTVQIQQPPAAVMTCQCNTEELRNSISDLQQNQRRQQDQLDRMTLNLTVLKSSVGPSGYSQRVGESEGVRTLMEDLKKLKEEMKNELAERGTFVAANTTGTSATDQGVCVWPYRRGGGSCYYVHQEDRLGWGAAKDHCRSLQGRLAAPTRLAALHAFLLKQRLSRAYTYWLGASNNGAERSWVWSDGRVVAAEVWGGSPPPPSAHSRTQRCLTIKPGYKMEASAELCREIRFFICQQERLL